MTLTETIGAWLLALTVIGLIGEGCQRISGWLDRAAEEID